eukprot:CAMPEP_0172821944 /NCGR_PEP_ID=MMETSP1075-20121228/16338_1 /TAXON_ID=2916 /ORGANISM="Ceratium fusus, Strain PA161109" /LENGTH=119 /DNA_ID=CAMNT_0013662877 /DNA_START=39 /DNA_END=398 /DNA_ORIENTATION=-
MGNVNVGCLPDAAQRKSSHDGESAVTPRVSFSSQVHVFNYSDEPDAMAVTNSEEFAALDVRDKGQKLLNLEPQDGRPYSVWDDFWSDYGTDGGDPSGQPPGREREECCDPSDKAMRACS